MSKFMSFLFFAFFSLFSCLSFSAGIFELKEANEIADIHKVQSTIESADNIFVFHPDGTITHKPTGLVFYRCLLGQNYSEGKCHGEGSRGPWDEVLPYVEAMEFLGHDDWRVPNKNELFNVVTDVVRYVDTDETSTNHSILTSSPGNTAGTNYWAVSRSGGAFTANRSIPLYVVIVRSGGGWASYKAVRKSALTFLSENLPDGTYQLGAATKRWRFKTADVAVPGLKAVRVSADAALGIQTAEIPLGDVAANTEFLVELPLQVSRGNQAVARSVWKLVDGTGKDVQISNSKTNTFWLSLRTNRPPQFAALQKTALGGEVGNLLQLPLQATDADGDALTFSVVSGGGSIIDKVSRVSNKAWQGSFAQAGVQPLQLAVSDGLEQDLINIDAVIYTGSGLANFFADVQYPGTDDINSVYSAVHFLAGKGIVMGASTQAGERYFEPARAATQAEALKMLLLAAQERGFVQLQQAPYIPEHYQNQISQNGQLFDYSWAADYAYTAEQLGMVDNLQLFEPAAALNREQAAHWLEQLLELESPLAVLKARGLTDRYQFTDATAFAQPAHYQAALKTALFGYLGTLGQNFRPADPINRGDFAVIAARVLRTATVVGLTSQQVQLAERFGQQMPVVKHGQTLQINGVTGLAVSEISQQSQLIKEEWLDPAQSYVRIGITLDDGTALGTARMIDQLASKPLLLNTNNLQLTRSSMINLIVLLENTRSGVISAQYLPLALDFADKDGDGRRDDVDAFPEDNRYSRDANKNGVPDEVEDLLRELGIDGTAKATVNGVAQSYSLAYAIAFGLAYDKTTTGLPQDTTAPVIQLPPVLTIKTPHSDGLPATNWQLANYLAAVKAVDNLDLHVKLSHDAPARFAIGQTLLTFTATDQAGNISKATATVSLELVAVSTRKSRIMKIILLSQPQQS